MRFGLKVEKSISYETGFRVLGFGFGERVDSLVLEVCCLLSMVQGFGFSDQD